MGVRIQPSDLQFRYVRKKDTRDLPKFAGKPDPHPFDRDDLYEVIPLFEAVMDALGTTDGRVLHRLEELLHNHIPRCVDSREGVYDGLVETMADLLGD